MGYRNIFHNTIDTLVELNKDNRADIGNSLSSRLSSVDFAKAFCTVRINCGRRAGHTSYINTRWNSCDLVIATTEANAVRYRSLGIEAISANSLKYNLDTCGRYKFYEKYLTVYVDEPTLCSHHINLDDIYRALVTGDFNQTFVLLGM
jgi:hypothetical protein